jgi:putative ABC transport system permease protein
VFGWDWKDGSDESLAAIKQGGTVVTDKFAEKHDLKVGSAFTLAVTKGESLRLRVAGISKPDRFNPLSLGDVTIDSDTYAASFTAERERYAFVKASAGAGPALHEALKPYADVQLQTSATFEKEQAAWVDQILAIFYVLLALCVLVSLFGIVNTLALSVLERTRELGMLKAIGMTRRQVRRMVRRMVRHESVVTALIGSTLGIAVGLFLAALATTALSDEGLRFGLPIGSLIAFTIVAIVAGMLAAILPARRAARLNVLEALQYE